MNKHTPGPWTYLNDRLLNSRRRGGVEFAEIRGSHHEFIADIPNTNGEQDDANGRLMAEAPAMAEVLRDIAALLPAAGRMHPKDIYALQIRVVAVLAKAGL